MSARMRLGPGPIFLSDPKVVAFDEIWLIKINSIFYSFNYYEGIYMVKVILAEIYMLEHFL